MNISSSQKLVVFGLVLALLGIGGYFMLMRSSDEVDVNVMETALGQDILNLTVRLKNVSIDSSIFSSVLFTSLRDFSFVPAPEVRGRPDPFAPIGADASLPGIMTRQVYSTTTSPATSTSTSATVTNSTQ